MQVFVNPAKCQGQNRCARIAPDLDRERVARLTADNCPEYAVSASDQGDSQ